MSPHAVPCCAVVICCQVALEGAINSKLAQSSLARGELPQGDLIPWTMGQQFQVRLLLLSLPALEPLLHQDATTAGTGALTWHCSGARAGVVPRCFFFC